MGLTKDECSEQYTEVRELDEGGYVIIDDVPCQINSYSTAKPGKHGSAKARIEAEGVFDGQKRSLSQPVDQKIWVPIIECKQGQVIDVRDGEIQVMDLETYDNFVMQTGDKDFSIDEEIGFLEHEGKRQVLGHHDRKTRETGDTEVYDSMTNSSRDTEVYDPSDETATGGATDTEVYDTSDSDSATPAYCPACGSALAEYGDVDFCPDCGESL